MSTPSLDVADQLECPICMDVLWEPKLLNCGHTFCLKCLHELFQPEQFPQNPVVACPVCRKKTPVTNEGVAGLNSNFALHSLLETMSPLKPKTTAEMAKTADGEATVCEIHNEIRKFYCCSCEVLICRDCTVVDHPRPEHKCMNLDEAYTWRRELNKKELQLAVKVVKLAKKSKGILQSAETTLNQRCDQVISEIEQCQEAGLEQLQQKTNAIEAFQDDLEAEVLELQDLTEDATKTDLLDQSNGMIESLTSLWEQQDEMLEKPEAVQYPVFGGLSEEIQDWPKALNQGISDKEGLVNLYQEDSAVVSPGDSSCRSWAVPPMKCLDLKLEGGPQPLASPVDKGCENQGRGYFHPLLMWWGGPDHRRRSGPDHRGRSGPDHRGRGGPDHRGRGGPDYRVKGGPDYREKGGPDHQGRGGPDHRGRGGLDHRGRGGPDHRGRGGPDHRGRGGPDNRGRGGPDNRGRGGPDNRGRGGSDHRGKGRDQQKGRGGKEGQGKNERGRATGNQKKI